MGNVIVRPTVRNVVITPSPREVLIDAVAERGPTGATGEPGPAGSSDLELVAHSAVGGGRVVVIRSDGELEYATQADPDHRWLSVGVTVGAVAGGDTATVRVRGVLEDPSWSWTPRAALFLGTNGLLTHVEPVSPSFSRIVAVAINATAILVDPQPPITLA